MIIYQAIKNCILALVVCRKYGLRYNPFCRCGNAEYNYIFEFIQLNPFHPEFISVLFHEVGHRVHDKMVNYKTFFELDPNEKSPMTFDEDQDYFKLLEAETFASRFAMKTKRANKQFLLHSFNTYCRLPFTVKDSMTSKDYFMRYIDCIAANNLRILNHKSLF